MPTKAGTKRATKRATKKSARKAATKRVSTKKATPKKKRGGKQPIIHAQGKQCFWVHDGPVLTNLMDLHNALHEMDDACYTYHAEGEANDFAEWVEWVLQDSTCANALRRAKQRPTAASVVKRRLTHYEY